MLRDVTALQSKGNLVVLSRALEECVLGEPAREGHPVVVLALFQRAAYFEASRRRFARVARACSACVVGFAGGVPRMPRGATHCPLDPDEPLADQWVLAVLAPDFGMGLFALDRRALVANESTLEQARGFRARVLFERRAVARELETILATLGRRIPAEVEDTLRGVAAAAGRARESPAERRSARAFASVVRGLESAYHQRLELERRLRRARDAGLRDALTGLYNRRFLDEYLGGRAADAPPFARLSVVLCDVDRFKEVNDRHGHAFGDAVLREVAEALQSCLRESDVGVRWGGDEFLFLLPGAPLEAARAVAERQRAAVEALGIRTPVGGCLEPRVSCGVACMTDTQELLPTVDAALRRAKADGRNRVAAASPVAC